VYSSSERVGIVMNESMSSKKVALTIAQDINLVGA